jgi:ribA/ribD-fused uncharacterized protein
MDTTPILSFRGTTFSNFLPCPVELDGVTYPSVEHAYQAAKTNDPAQRERVRGMPTSGKAKQAGRKVTIREDWEESKIEVMRGLLRQKFAPGTECARLLLETGERELIEVNTWGDRFWGESPRGVGENHLGKLLMERRAELRT